MAIRLKEFAYAAIADAVEAGPFYAVDYDVAQGAGEFQRMRILTEKLVVPNGLEANETNVTMGVPREKHSKGFRKEITQVTWHVIISFAEEVSCEDFLETFSRRIVPAEGAPRQFNIDLESCDIINPPRNEPSQGTLLTLVVQITPAPELG